MSPAAPAGGHLGALARAVVGARLGARLLARSAVASRPGWTRTNYRDRPVTLDGGALAACGAAAGALGTPRAPGLVAAAALAGAYDDLFAPGAETAGDKGLAGHLAAARAGRVSGGVVKVAVIGAAAWWAAGRAATGPADRAVRAVAVAATANVVNLLDLRPGRAAKAVLLVAAVSGGGRAGPLATAAAAAAGVALPGDLAERTMLGDTGAGALGALLGLRLASGRAPLAVVTAVVATALTVASERISFSAVIAGRPWLRWWDELGRLS